MPPLRLRALERARGALWRPIASRTPAQRQAPRGVRIVRSSGNVVDCRVELVTPASAEHPGLWAIVPREPGYEWLPTDTLEVDAMPPTGGGIVLVPVERLPE